MRFPRQIDLFVTIVQVRLVDKKVMREEAECEDDDNTPEGFWDGDNDTVYVGKWLRKKRRREVLMHELAHACLDWRDEGKCES
jgi:Zn-dependent peptidase ImmA (M78 family)